MVEDLLMGKRPGPNAQYLNQIEEPQQHHEIRVTLIKSLLSSNSTLLTPANLTTKWLLQVLCLSGSYMCSCSYDFVIPGVNKALLLDSFFYISLQTQHEETQAQGNKESQLQ